MHRVTETATLCTITNNQCILKFQWLLTESKTCVSYLHSNKNLFHETLHQLHPHISGFQNKTIIHTAMWEQLKVSEQAADTLTRPNSVCWAWTTCTSVINTWPAPSDSHSEYSYVSEQSHSRDVAKQTNFHHHREHNWSCCDLASDTWQ